MNAQQKDSIAGEYYLEGVMETASVIQLNPDFTFKFFYSYGALDRYGSGKWAIEDNIIELNSYKSDVIGVKGVVLTSQTMKLAVLAGIGKNGVLVCKEMSTVAVPLAEKTFW